MKVVSRLLIVLLSLMLCGTAFGYTLSGEITGAEFLGGITYVYAISLDSLTFEFHIGLALFGTGNYYVFNVPAGTYLITAFQDRDGNLTPSVDDYMGYYGGTTPTPVEIIGNTSDLDILVAPLPFTGISGTISCPTGHSGATLIMAATDPLFENITNYGFLTVLTGNGDYSVFVDPGQYYVLAFMEEDYNLGRSSGDPQVFWGVPGSPTLIDVTQGSAQNINLPLMEPPDLTFTLTPQSSPVVIPPQGGTFTYNIAIHNLATTPLQTKVWCDAVLPNGQTTTPLLGPISLNFPVGFNGNRNRNQTLPGSAPAGQYTFTGHLGVYPVIVWAESSFPVTKTGTDGINGDWSSSWDDQGDWTPNQGSSAPSIPMAPALVNAYPNPFNPVTTIHFDLPESGQVQLAVYDISGRLIENLVDSQFQAGLHQVSFDGSKLTSGIYLYRLSTGDYSVEGKMTLMK
ncbi:MAG: T9SS type A sorting domain-containing protein [bacterium]|nr:T9SS type A sorting domain-containing protein [bacterium]